MGKNVEVIKAHNSDDNLTNGTKKRVAAYCRVSKYEEEQLKSYNSQIKYFRAKIAENKNWILVEIYADAGISGVTSIKRPGFMQMIDDCMAGKIDIILTKSISRFSRNVVDTIEYVRKLQKKNISVIFEEENINTLGMNSELLLTILGSVHEQEIYNMSANIKAGLRMKMKRGEILGGFSVYGYDYDKIKKEFTINEKEAEIVKNIFTWYADGIRTVDICCKLNEQGIPSPRGKSKWCCNSIIKILGNNKYIGVLEQGKSYSLDPLTGKKRLNFGEKDKYVVYDHHEAIVSQDLYNKVHDLMLERVKHNKLDGYIGRHRDKNVKYTFSKKIKCSCCGRFFRRNEWKKGTGKKGVYWTRPCNENHNYDSKCICKKSIYEETMKKIFVESYNRIYKYNPEFLDEFIKSLGGYLRAPQEKLTKEIKSLEEQQSKLLDNHLEDLIDVEEFDKTYKELKLKRDNLVKELIDKKEQSNVDKRLMAIKDFIKKQPEMTEFNQAVFDNLVDEIIIGGYDDEGNPAENKITIIYKAGERDELRLDDFFNLKSVRSQANSVEQTSQNGARPVAMVTAPQMSLCSLGYTKPSDVYSKGKPNICLLLRCEAAFFHDFALAVLVESGIEVITVRFPALAGANCCHFIFTSVNYLQVSREGVIMALTQITYNLNP